LAAYGRGGEPALRAAGRLGRKPRLTAPQTQRLEALLATGADRHGWPNPAWTRRRIGVVVQREFGRRYTPAGVWHLLGRLGYSAQRPVRRAKERQEGRVLGWRRRTWPAVKKNSGSTAAASSSSTKAP
jgi:transposase